MTPERKKRLTQVAACRQLDLTVVLENVHDPHNISAVLRSCDAVGIGRIYYLRTDQRIVEDIRLVLGQKSSAGTKKWVEIIQFDRLEDLMSLLRSQYTRIIGAALKPKAESLYTLDLAQSTALVFGNEHDGISEELSAVLDGHFVIPQKGMVQSLNISVACAVTLFEALRQRDLKGLYRDEIKTPTQAELAITYIGIHNREHSFLPPEED
jgi:tRNA (guanosine-2'-O-)-methyltransferase